MRIRISLPEDRNYAGRLEVLDANGGVILGPFLAAGRAHDQLASAHGNPLRNPLLPYGDTPLGVYGVRGVVESGPGTSLDRNVFGAHGVVLLEPVSGAAALADAQGRFRLFIQGSGDDEGELHATAGAVRLLDRDQKQLVALLRRISERVICEVGTTAERGAKVVVTLPPLDCDPPPLPERPHNAARPAASLVSRTLLASATGRTARSATRFFVVPELSGSGGGTGYGDGGDGGGSTGDGDGGSGPVDTGTDGTDAGVEPVISQPVLTATDSAPSPGADLTPAPDDSVVTGMETGANLLSTAPQSGLSSPYDADQGGWLVSQPQVEPYTNVPATGGSLTSYVGNDVETYSGMPSDGGSGNALTGGPPIDPSTGNSSTDDANNGSLTSGPAASPLSSPLLLAANDTPDPANANLASDVGGPNYIGPVDGNGQAATATNTDTTFEGVVYHQVGTETINGQVFNSYLDDSGTKWLDINTGIASSPPAASAADTSQAPTSNGFFEPDTGVHQLGPDEQAALVSQYAQYDAQLAASQTNQSAPQPDQSVTTFDPGNLPPFSVDQTSLSNPTVSQQIPVSSGANAPADAGTAGASSPGGSSAPNDILGAFGINTGLAAVRDAFTPMSPTGGPLQGPLNLYSGPSAKALAQAAPDGYMIQDTVYYGPADLAEQALRSKLGIPSPGMLPPDQYNPIWGQASRDAVIDATLSGQGVTSYNDLATLAPGSIQAEVELPWLRGLGAAASGLQVVGGVLTIASATDPNLPGPLVPVAVVSGSLQFTGGVAYGVGAWGADGAMMAAGAGVAETGGLLGIPLALYGLGVAIESGVEYLINGMVQGQIEQDADAARRGSTTGELPPPYINNGPTGDPLNDAFLFP